MLSLDADGPPPTCVSATQRTRLLTERWAERHLYCASCGGGFRRTAANTPVLDFTCLACARGYELKSKQGSFGPTVPCGAFASMMAALARPLPPAFVFLAYTPALHVDTVFAVPPWAITPTMVTQRPPLKPTARRAGWVGATLQLAQVPSTCRVTFVESGALRSATAVQADWARTAFLAEPRAAQSRGWTLDVLRVVESLGPGTFTLAQVYAHAPELQAAHPDNHHVHDKIRQQLQVLRDRRLLRFLGGGRYALTASATP